jgi:serine protease SohB
VPVLFDYLSFLAKTLTMVGAIAIVIGIIVMARGKGAGKKEGSLRVTSLNDFYKKLHKGVEHALLSNAGIKALKKAEKAERKLAKQAEGIESDKTRTFVIDFNGDMHASAADNLRHEVTAVLGHAKVTDEVVVRLESPGGVVHGYGLAASQLARIRDAGIPLTICVDKIAASGGYMMACIGNRIITAPFAVLGSIGVVAQIPNFHRLLKKNDVDVELITAGTYKRTLTTIGENTSDGRKKFQEEVNTVHGLFKTFVSKYRPKVNIEEVATGESWFGIDAVAKDLADENCTSDEYLAKKSKDSDLYQITFTQPKAGGIKARLGLAASSVLENAAVGVWERLINSRHY